ncbi:hypothetical protein ACFQ7N_36740 [Streptomyces niveus]
MVLVDERPFEQDPLHQDVALLPGDGRPAPGRRPAAGLSRDYPTMAASSW